MPLPDYGLSIAITPAWPTWRQRQVQQNAAPRRQLDNETARSAQPQDCPSGGACVHANACGGMPFRSASPRGSSNPTPSASPRSEHVQVYSFGLGLGPLDHDMNSDKWAIAGWGLGPAAGAGERDPAPGSSPLRPEAAPKCWRKMARQTWHLRLRRISRFDFPVAGLRVTNSFVAVAKRNRHGTRLIREPRIALHRLARFVEQPAHWTRRQLL
jgi:hypothetical protein